MANVNRKIQQSENKENFGKINKTFEVDIKSVQDQIMKQLEIKNEKSNDKQQISEQENSPVTFINNNTVTNHNPDILKAKDFNDVTLPCDEKQIKTHKEILDLYENRTENPTKFDEYERLMNKITELENDQLRLNEEKSMLVENLLEEKSEIENLKTIIADLQQCGSKNSNDIEIEKENMAKQIEELESKLYVLQISYSNLHSKNNEVSANLNNKSQGDRFKNKITEMDVEILKLKERSVKIEKESLYLNKVNLVLKNELKEKDLKVKVLIDNIQTIITSFQSIEKDFSSNSDIGQSIFQLKTEEEKSDTITNIAENSNGNEISENIFPEDVQNKYFSGTITRRYSCDKCTYTHYKKSELQTHLKLHTKLVKNECNKCGEMYDNENDFKQHISTHIDLSYFSCKYCEQSFNSKTDVENHIKLHHRTVKIKCEQCDKQFQHLSEFQDHKMTHRDPNKFSCESCAKIFKNSSDLTKHFKAHTNKQFCHMYNNFQRCKYETNCIYLHENAPICKYDGFCTRPSCQYKHKYGCLEKNLFLSDRKTFMRKKQYNGKIDNLEEDVKENKISRERSPEEYVIP